MLFGIKNISVKPAYFFNKRLLIQGVVGNINRDPFLILAKLLFQPQKFYSSGIG